MFQRPWWSYVVAAVCGAVIFVLIDRLELGAIVGGALAGGLAGLSLAGLGRSYVLGWCAGDVLLVRSSPWKIEGRAVEAQFSHPAPAAAKKGMLVHTVTLDGQRYQLAKGFGERFSRVAGVAL